MSLHTKNIEIFYENHENIERGLSFFYQWLERPLDFIPKSDAPQKEFNIFEKAEIIHYLWKYVKNDSGLPYFLDHDNFNFVDIG